MNGDPTNDDGTIGYIYGILCGTIIGGGLTMIGDGIGWMGAVLGAAILGFVLLGRQS